MGDRAGHVGNAARSGSTLRRVVLGLARFALVAGLLAGGAYAAYWFNASSGTARKGVAVDRPEASRLVVVDVAERGAHKVVVRAMGEVIPAMEAAMTPRVSGAVVEQHADFVPGGFFREGEFMLQLDRVDYEQALEQRRSDLDRARAALQIELGDQALAREELELLDIDVPELNRDLILRIPQVNRARAEVRSAEAAVERASLDLGRTRIVAPFDGHVVTRGTSVGNNVGVGDEVATFVASAKYWIELTLPVAGLRWIEAAESAADGSVAVVRDDRAWGPGAVRRGRVSRVIGRLEGGSRLARVLVSVPDPLALDAENAGVPRLFLGSFVEVEIEGRSIPDAVVLDRDLVREGDVVWVMGDDDRLVTRPVRVAYRGPRVVYVTNGLSEGDRVVRTNLTAPVDGMLLRLADDAGAGAPPMADAEAPRDG